MTRVRLTTIILVTLLAICAAIARAETADELPSFLDGKWADAPRVSLSIDTRRKQPATARLASAEKARIQSAARLGTL
jgi:hypothetical protein